MSKFQYVQGQDTERGFLVGINVYQSNPLLSVEDSLDELELLADTAGIEVVGRTYQNVKEINSATFIGSGKIAEISDQLDYLDVDVVIFDDELSPRHQREIEKRLGDKIRLLDRSALILDIFAQHARTREGALQVELAQYEYRLPRLTRQWTHLARQAGGSSVGGGSGGVGLRGPGETQLEVDRREISRKITKLKEDLEQVRLHRSLHREKRKKSGLATVALVGYTNAGKSTLINALANASNIYVADQLFATLDPTTRRVELPHQTEVLVSDTVGFIQKLPTTLIAAFRATLEEIHQADLLLHVVDVSHPNAEQHIEAVEDTLAEIDAAKVPRILVLNKVDKLTSGMPQLSVIDEYEYMVGISARTGSGIDDLKKNVVDSLEKHQIALSVLIPYQDGHEYSYLYENGYIQSEATNEVGWCLTVKIPKKMYNHFVQYRLDESTTC